MRRLMSVEVIFLCLIILGQTRAQEKMPPQDYVPYEKPPEAIRQVQAVYPEAARKDSLEGTVWVKVWVDESGQVARVTVQKSDGKIFNQPAIEAAKQWMFKPAVMNGKPVSVWVSIPFRFELAGNNQTQSLPPPILMRTTQYPPPEDAKHDKEPVTVKQVQPKYPDEAILQRIEGTVWTKMWIDESGKVVEVIVTKSDNEALNTASMDAGMQWEFKPALLNGKSVAVWLPIPFRFKIATY